MISKAEYSEYEKDVADTSTEPDKMEQEITGQDETGEWLAQYSIEPLYYVQYSTVQYSTVLCTVASLVFNRTLVLFKVC